MTGGVLNITAVLDQTHYGFSKLTILNATALKWTFIRGDGGIIGDELLLLKKPGKSGGGNSTSSSAGSGNSTSSSVGPTATTYVTTQVVSEYTTYCPYATTFTQGSSTYTVTSVSSSVPAYAKSG
jgi:acid phosphatase